MDLVSPARATKVRCPEDGDYARGVIRSARTWVHHSEEINFKTLERAAVFHVPNSTDPVDMGETVGDWFVLPRNIEIELPAEPVNFAEAWERWNFGSRARPRSVTQRKSVEALRGGNDGVLALACGKGKTVIALMHAAARRYPFVVVLDNGGLGWQWVQRCLEFYRAEPSDIGTIWGWDPRDARLSVRSEDHLDAAGGRLARELADIGNELWPSSPETPNPKSAKFRAAVLQDADRAKMSQLRDPKTDRERLLLRAVRITDEMASLTAALCSGGDVPAWSRPVVIAGTRTLANHAEELPLRIRQRFGTVVFDEAHHLPAPVLRKTAPLFFGQRVALTATPVRGDGKSPLIHAHCGPVLVEDLRSDMPARGVVLYTDVWPSGRWLKVVPDWARKNPIAYAKKVSAWLNNNEARNGKLADVICALLAGDRKVLVLTEGEEHTRALARMVNDLLGAEVCAAVSGASVPVYADRAPIMETHRATVATFGVAMEGLDVAEFDALVYCTLPSNWKGLAQSKGRIERVLPGKRQPVVVYLLDQHIALSNKRMERIDMLLREHGLPPPEGMRLRDFAR